MATIAPTTTRSFFESAFEKVSAFAREHRVRRARRIALVTLMDMDAHRLDDLGIALEDVVEALNTQSGEPNVLETRRAARAANWSPATA